MTKFIFTACLFVVSIILYCHPINKPEFIKDTSLPSIDTCFFDTTHLNFLGVYSVDTFAALTNFNPFLLFKKDSNLTIYMDSSKQLLYFFLSSCSYDLFKIINTNDSIMEIESCMRGISMKVSFFNDHAFSYLLFKEPEKILIYKKTTIENILYFKLKRIE